MKRFACALLTISTVLVSSSVAFAGERKLIIAESANVQTSTQVTTIEGNGNTSIQNTRQVNSVRRGRGRRRYRYSRTDVNVQDVYQNSSISGDYNINDQYSEQINRVSENYKRKKCRRRR